jgi:hypothetical protein
MKLVYCVTRALHLRFKTLIHAQRPVYDYLTQLWVRDDTIKSNHCQRQRKVPHIVKIAREWVVSEQTV